MDRHLFKLALVFAIAASFNPIARSQAPGDTDGQSCTNSVGENGQVILLNSNHYGTLLSSAGWTQTPAGRWSESGNLCARSLESCSVDSSETNWIVTQYILRTANVTYPLKVTVELDAHTRQECLDSTICELGNAGVYYYPSDGPIATDEQLNTANYVEIGATKLTLASETYSYSFFLDGTYDRFYVAVVDDGYCVRLRRLFVFYSACTAEETQQVVYPVVPIGDTGVPATASCLDTFAPSPGSSMSITCNPDGSFSGSPDCSICTGGHFMHNGQCFACSAGNYPDTPTSCAPCPANSNSNQAGTAVCPCNNGYYRASTDPPSEPCGVGPGPASALTVTSVNDNEVGLTWIAATMTGGRLDIFYRIAYRTPTEATFTYYDPPSRITGTSATLPIGAHSAPSIVVVVVTENGVSLENPDTFPVSERTSNEVNVTIPSETGQNETTTETSTPSEVTVATTSETAQNETTTETSTPSEVTVAITSETTQNETTTEASTSILASKGSNIIVSLCLTLTTAMLGVDFMVR